VWRRQNWRDCLYWCHRIVFASVERRKFERAYIHTWTIRYFYVVFLTQIITVLVLTVWDFGIKANSASLESSITEDRLWQMCYWTKAWVFFYFLNKNHIWYQFQLSVIGPLTTQPWRFICIIGIELEKRQGPVALYCKAFKYA